MSSQKPTLIGFLPPIGGLPKTEDYFDYHKALINTGDIVYALAITLLSAGNNNMAWNFSANAKTVNEYFSKVVWAIPCRIAPPPFHLDGFPYEAATNFIKQLDIPFTSVTESIQSSTYEYDKNLHKTLSNKVVTYLKTISEKTITIGTRGEYSAEILNKLGIKNVEPIGCPSLYMNGPTLKEKLIRKKPFSDVHNVAVTYSNYQRRTESLIQNAMSIAASNGFFFIEQTSNVVPKLLYYPDKLDPIDLIEANKHYGSLDFLRTLYNTNRLRYFTNYGNWKDFISKMDFVFGARMHGLTPAIESGIPAHFIAHDSRVREMCEFFKLPFSPEHVFSGKMFDLHKLYESTDYSSAEKIYPDKYKNFLRFLTNNNINSNTDDNLEIMDKIDYTPSPGVEIELDPGTHKTASRHHVNNLFEIASSLTKQGQHI